MKNKLSLLVMVFITTVMISNGKGRPSASVETRPSKPFHYINIKGEMKVNIVQDETHSIIVDAAAGHNNDVITMLNGDTLFVYKTDMPGQGIPKVTLKLQDLKSLDVSGKSKVVCSGFANPDNIAVRSSGGAKVKVATKSETKTTGFNGERKSSSN